jgi:beta-galactosamide-alpha-2,3-sialyltransferase
MLCRTPLQARICLRLAQIDGLERPDILYFTQDDTSGDRHYRHLLEEIAGRLEYLHVPRQRFDLLNHAIAITRAGRRFRGHARIYLASIDAPLFRWIIRRNGDAEIMTFDDGTANITASSNLRRPVEAGRMKLYIRLAGLPSVADVRQRSVLHSTLYPSMENIVPRARLRPVEIFADQVRPAGGDARTRLTFFVGQPFHEYLPPDAVRALGRKVRQLGVDRYVLHPRERTPLVDGIPELEKHGELAEIAILRAAGAARPLVVGAFSTVLFNLSDSAAERVYLHVPGVPRSSEWLALARGVGCQVVYVTAAAAEGEAWRAELS